MYGALGFDACQEQALRAPRANRVFGTEKSDPYQKRGYG
jgi:hypothetical protein